MKDLFFSERSPLNREERNKYMLRSLFLCFLIAPFGVATALVLSALGPIPWEIARALGSCMVAGLHWRQLRYWEFDRDRILEMTAGGVLFYYGWMVGGWWTLFIPIGFIAHVRPFLHGPEPGGWQAILNKNGKERLKGRRERE
jgi:hypothetical protein